MNDPGWRKHDGLESQIDVANDELAALVIAGDHHAASRVLIGPPVRTGVREILRCA